MKITTPKSDLVRKGLNTDCVAHELRGPFFVLDFLRSGALVRRITVLAASSEAALFKAGEQLDDGETLSFCFTSTTKIAIN